MFLKSKTTISTKDYLEKISQLKQKLNNADAIIIGAGAGLSTSAGLEYGGERFNNLFSEYIKRYNLTDMYSSAFYPFKTLEEYWGYWCMHVYHNRYAAKLNSTYNDLYKLVSNKNYFVITTNGDHLFRLNNFPKERLFYTQGDYGVFACSKACHNETYDNKEIILNMVNNLNNLKIPTNLIPRCPKCNAPMTVNLRKDEYFIEDDGWNLAMNRYSKFLNENKNKQVVFLELGVGYNTPSIIKYPFWQMTYKNKNAFFVTVNMNDAICAKEIINKSICIEDDIHKVIADVF